MVQAAELRHGYNLTTHICIGRSYPTTRCSLLQREMGPVFVIVADVLGHQPFQVPLVKHDHMVEQVSSTVANPALGDPILPRTSEAGPLGLDTEALYRADHLTIEICGAIEDQVFRNRVVRERLALNITSIKPVREFLRRRLDQPAVA